MESSFHIVTDELVIDDRTREWCLLPYPGHPKGCPNYGKKDVCPPRAPGVRSYFDFDAYLSFVIVRFDLAYHVQKMHKRLPHWTERQCRNLLYWQSSVTGTLKGAVRDLISNPDIRLKQDRVTYVPEAMGVDVFETCKNLNIPIERNPLHYVHKIAMVGKGREK